MFFVSDYKFLADKLSRKDGTIMLVSTSKKLKDYQSYVVEQITDTTTVEKVVFSQFNWLYAKSGLKSMLEFTTLEFAKYKNGDGNRFEDWIQEYRVLMLGLLKEYQNYHLCDIADEMTARQAAHFNELYVNGATTGELFFKALSWRACGILRDKVRQHNVTRVIKHKHCSDDLYINTNVSEIFRCMTPKEKTFVIRCKEKYHLNQHQTNFIIVCFNCSQVDCYDFTTKLATALSCSPQNIRKLKSKIQAKYNMYK